jgi:hypothetical protein
MSLSDLVGAAYPNCMCQDKSVRIESHIMVPYQVREFVYENRTENICLNSCQSTTWRDSRLDSHARLDMWSRSLFVRLDAEKGYAVCL